MQPRHPIYGEAFTFGFIIHALTSFVYWTNKEI